MSGESSPHSSSAPSPTGHLPQYMDENLQSSQQQASLRPIGTGRTTKKDRCTQPYGEIADPSSASHLWGIAPDMGELNCYLKLTSSCIKNLFAHWLHVVIRVLTITYSLVFQK